MGIITNLFLSCLPYALAALVGFMLAGISNDSTHSKRPGSGNRGKSDAENAGKPRSSSNHPTGGGRDESEQARLEACDPDEKTIYPTDYNNNENDESAFDLEHGVHVPYKKISNYTEGEMIVRSRDFYQRMDKRRSVRMFRDEPVPLEVIENIIKTAGTAPSGAHTQPWLFSVVRDRRLKEEIREIIEAEERINYEKRMGQTWVDDLKHIGTTYRKPYLSTCSAIIVVFKQLYSYDEGGSRKTHYYNEQSTAISVGLLLAAVENAGLVTCTTTPMNAGPRLRTLLGREAREKVTLLLPLGYPAKDATVPDLHRKPLEEIMDLHDQVED